MARELFDVASHNERLRASLEHPLSREDGHRWDRQEEEPEAASPLLFSLPPKVLLNQLSFLLTPAALSLFASAVLRCRFFSIFGIVWCASLLVLLACREIKGLWGFWGGQLLWNDVVVPSATFTPLLRTAGMCLLFAGSLGVDCYAGLLAWRGLDHFISTGDCPAA